jgi:hypothetical protein
MGCNLPGGNDKNHAKSFLPSFKLAGGRADRNWW